MTLTTLPLLAALLAAAPAAKAAPAQPPEEVIDRVAATVDGEVVTLSEI